MHHPRSPRSFGALPLAALWFFLASCSGGPTRPAAETSGPAPITTAPPLSLDLQRLPSGLSVISIPRPEAPSTTLQIWLSAGYGHTGDEALGASHALARWLSAAGGPLSTPIGALGGRVEAWSAPDALVVQIQVPDEGLEAATEALGRAWSTPLTEETLTALKAAWKGALSSPYSPLAESLRMSLGGHPYGRGLGPAAVEALRAADVQAFRGRCAHVRGGLVVLEGARHPEKARAWLARHLPTPAKALSPCTSREDPGLEGERISGELRIDRPGIDSGHLWLSLISAAETPEEAAALATLGRLLANHMEGWGRGRLHGDLKVSTSTLTPLGVSRLALGFTFPPSALDAVWGRWLESVRRVGGGISTEALEEAARDVHRQLLAATTSPAGHGRWIAESVRRFGPEGPSRVLAALRRPDPEAIRRVFRRTRWRHGQAVINLPSPKGEGDRVMADGLWAGRLMEQQSRLTLTPPEAHAPGTLIEVSPHLRAMYVPTPQSPGVIVHVAIPQPPRSITVAQRMATQLLHCPGRIPVEASLGAGGLHLQALTSHDGAPAALQAIEACLDPRRWSPAVVEAAMARSRAALEREGTPIMEARRQALAALGGAAALPGRAPSIVPAAEVVRAGLRLTRGPRLALIGAAQPPQDLAALISGRLSPGAAAAPPPPPLKAEAPPPPKVSVRDRLHLTLAFPTPERAEPPWRYGMLAAVLTAEGGALREMLSREVGAEATVSAEHVAVGNGGLLVVQLSAPAGQMKQARQALWSAVERLKTIGVSRGLFEQLRRARLGEQAVTLSDPTQQVRKIASGVLLERGATAEGLLAIDRRMLESLAPMDIQEAARSIFVEPGYGEGLTVEPPSSQKESS